MNSFSQHINDFEGFEYDPPSEGVVDCSDQSVMHITNGTQSSTITGGILSNVDVIIHGTFVINSLFEFYECNVFFDSGAEIEILSGNTLLSFNTRYKACGTDLWNQILVSSGAHFESLFSIYENALSAVKVEGTGSIDFSYSTFRNNVVGITFESNSVNQIVENCHFTGNALLLNPYSTIYSQKGVFVRSAQSTITIGSEQFPNFFDHLVHGVHSKEGREVNVLWNSFYFVGHGDKYGAAIFIDNELYTDSYLNVDYNYLHDCKTGIRKFKRSTLNASWNTFLEISEYAVFSSYANTLVSGGQANWDYSSFVSNTFDACNEGIHYIYSNDAKILVIRNTFINPTKFPSSYAFYMSNVTTAQGEGSVVLSSNEVHGYPSGFSLTNQVSPNIFENSFFNIYMNPNFLTEGVALYNCRYASVTCNFFESAGMAYSQAGIRASESIRLNIIENFFHYVGRAIQTDGQCNNSKLFGNEMVKCQIGIYLNVSVIGPQWKFYSSSGQPLQYWPQDNQWDGPSFAHIFNYNSSPTLSPFRYRDSSPIPAHQNSSTIINLFDIQPAVPFIATSTSAPIGFDACGELPLGLPDPDPDNPTEMQSNDEIAQMLDTMTVNPYEPDEAALHWMQEQALYIDLAYDSIDFSSSQYLIDFFEANNEEELGQIENIEALLDEALNDSTIYALGLNNTLWNGWNSAAYPVLNYELFYEIYSQYQDSRDSVIQIDSLELATLDSLAHLCPLYHGRAVFSSRALLDLHGMPWSRNPCEYSINATGRKTDAVEQAENDVFIYPNPASSKITIDSEVGLEENLVISVRNMLGVLVDEFVVPHYLLPFEHQVSNYSSGVYIVELRINSESHVVRLVVQ